MTEESTANSTKRQRACVFRDLRGRARQLRDIASVTLGPDMRRGIAELDGKGEVVGGIVVMRFGENALRVINRVKARLREVSRSLPAGVRIVPTYDRSWLIGESIKTLGRSLLEESVVVSLVILLFLFHLRSAMVPILVLPLAVLASFVPMYYLGITSNIMSLGGLALAIGVLVDASIVMVENAYRHVSDRQVAAVTTDAPTDVIVAAAQQVGRAIFFSLAIIIVSFVPVFLLEAQEGRMFRPLAFTKTFAMLAASILSITLVPMLMTFFIRGRLRPESENPISRAAAAIYEPILRLALRWKWTALLLNFAVIPLTVPLLFLIGMLGQGLLLSIATKSQMLATQAGIMTTMLPSMLLSGFMYPIENMPRALQLISAAIPARYFIDALRGILLKGNGLAELWPQALCLLGFALLMLVASAAAFVRRLA